MIDPILIAEQILHSFTQTSDGYRARVGKVQIAKWREQLDQAAKEPAANTERCVTCGASSEHWQPQHRSTS